DVACIIASYARDDRIEVACLQGERALRQIAQVEPDRHGQAGQDEHNCAHDGPKRKRCSGRRCRVGDHGKYLFAPRFLLRGCCDRRSSMAIYARSLSAKTSARQLQRLEKGCTSSRTSSSPAWVMAPGVRPITTEILSRTHGDQ